MEGLNLLGNYSVACHFKDNQHERFKAWAIKNKLPIVCLPEETGLIIENSIARCVGTKPCTVYTADGMETDVNQEGSFNL